ncbi:MAG TPA: SRPBCC domain-containing protein [Candidatus Limnocylindrales bacterium]
MASTVAPIVLEIETQASPDGAWAALTVPERVAEWFTDASPLGAVGTAYRLDFGDGSVVDGVVTELEPGRRFAHTWAWADGEPDQGTRVSWSIQPLADSGSKITLVHDGWSEAGLDASTRDDHEGYWIGYLEDLAAVLGPES